MTGARNPIVLAAGGTGGHVFPARALAEELLRRGHRVALITDGRGEAFGETSAVEIYRISAAGIGGGLLSKIRGVFMLGIGLLQAQRILRKLSPGAVVGFGGYPSLPTMAGATQTRLPTIIHEQNAVLGRVNRLIARRVTRIATSFASVKGIGDDDRNDGSSGRIVQTGNPVRDAVAALRGAPYPDMAGRLGLIVIGGSQGARTLGRTVPEAVARLPSELRDRLDVVQQARAEDVDEARETYARAGVAAEVEPFFADLPERLPKAHLAIARAGASTVSELTCIGRPAILVPYPYATDDHQTANARALEAAGAGWVIPDSDLDAVQLSERLRSLMGAPDILAKAAKAAHELGKPDAAARLADAVEATMAAPNGNHNEDDDKGSGHSHSRTEEEAA